MSRLDEAFLKEQAEMKQRQYKHSLIQAKTHKSLTKLSAYKAYQLEQLTLKQSDPRIVSIAQMKLTVINELLNELEGN